MFSKQNASLQLQFYLVCNLGAIMAQLASAWISEGEVSGSIFSDFNVS